MQTEVNHGYNTGPPGNPSTVPAPTHLTAESREFAQRDDEIVKYIAEAIVGRNHGTLPVMSPPTQKQSHWKARQPFQIPEETWIGFFSSLSLLHKLSSNPILRTGQELKRHGGKRVSSER